jgi:hypothetical protein
VGSRRAIQLALTSHCNKSRSTLGDAFAIFEGLTPLAYIITVAIIKALVFFTPQDAGSAFEYPVVGTDRNAHVIIKTFALLADRYASIVVKPQAFSTIRHTSTIAESLAIRTDGRAIVAIRLKAVSTLGNAAVIICYKAFGAI